MVNCRGRGDYGPEVCPRWGERKWPTVHNGWREREGSMVDHRRVHPVWLAVVWRQMEVCRLMVVVQMVMWLMGLVVIPIIPVVNTMYYGPPERRSGKAN